MQANEANVAHVYIALSIIQLEYCSITRTHTATKPCQLNLQPATWKTIYCMALHLTIKICNHNLIGILVQLMLFMLVSIHQLAYSSMISLCSYRLRTYIASCYHMHTLITVYSQTLLQYTNCKMKCLQMKQVSYIQLQILLASNVARGDLCILHCSCSYQQRNNLAFFMLIEQIHTTSKFSSNKHMRSLCMYKDNITL